MTRVIDLDELAPEAIEVVANGETYLLPGDIPVPDYLEIGKLLDALTAGARGEDSEESAGDLLTRLHDKVLELFRVHQPDITGEELPLGPARLAALAIKLYAGEVEEEDAPRPPKGGTKSTSRRKTGKSRSSR